MFLPDLPANTAHYLYVTYCNKGFSHGDIVSAYRSTERWLTVNIDPKYLVPGNVPSTLIDVAVLHVHSICARNNKAEQYARFGMHALIGQYRKH